MQHDFEIAYENYLSNFANNLSLEQKEAYKRYALGNRNRGFDSVQKLKLLMGKDFEGMTCLDIGSGYGGFLLALASQGANVTGIEYDSKLFELSRINISGEPFDISLNYGNILDRDVISADLKFDLIIINDVFEHIADIDYLFKRISELSHSETQIYFEIPNHRSYHAIRKEHHKFIFGLTMLDSGYWSELIGSYSLYHRPFEIYKLLFKSIGFKTILFDTDRNLSLGSIERVKLAFNDIDNEIINYNFKNDSIRNQIASNFARLKKYFFIDMNIKNEELIHLEYETYVWSGLASKDSFFRNDRYILLDLN